VKPMILKKYALSIPYKTMSIEEITNLPIDKISDDNSVLFFWTTHTFLPYCFDIIKAYGFKYYCTLSWNKVSGLTHQGIFRQTELVLVAYKGKLTQTIPQKGKAIPCLFTEQKGRHSRKPDIFFKIVKDKCPEPRISIFERELREGFETWGDEAPI